MEHVTTQPGRRWRRRIIAGLAMAVVVAAAGVWNLRRQDHPAVQVVALQGTVMVDGRRLVRQVPAPLPYGGRLAVAEDGAADLPCGDAGRLHGGAGTRLVLDLLPETTLFLDHGPLAVQWTAARPLAVLTPQALVRIGPGTVQVDARAHQTVVTVATGTADIAARTAGGSRVVSGGGEAVIGNRGWEFQSTAPPRILPWSEARILAAAPQPPQPVPGRRVHGQAVQRLAWSAPPAAERGRAPAFNGVVWPLRLAGGEQRCAIWLRAVQVVPAVSDGRPGMAVELLLDQGGRRFRLAATRLTATSTDWQLLGGDLSQAVPVDGGNPSPPLRSDAVRAVALSLPLGAVVLETGPMLVQTPAP